MSIPVSKIEYFVSRIDTIQREKLALIEKAFAPLPSTDSELVAAGYGLLRPGDVIRKAIASQMGGSRLFIRDVFDLTNVVVEDNGNNEHNRTRRAELAAAVRVMADRARDLAHFGTEEELRNAIIEFDAWEVPK